MSEQRNLILAVLISMGIFAAFHFFYEVPRAERLHALAMQEQAEHAGNQVQGRADSPSADVSAVGEGSIVPRSQARAESPRVPMNNQRLYGSVPLKGIRLDDLTFADYFTTIENKEHVDLLSPSGTESPYFAKFGWAARRPGPRGTRRRHAVEGRRRRRRAPDAGPPGLPQLGQRA